VEVWNCAWLHEAQFLKSVLEADGIGVWLPDEHTLAVGPHLGAALGGVRLLVPEDDAERAREILASAGTSPVDGAE
jgi:hypothetical protein